MASNLGTVFVELSLDDKIYKQKLSEILTSTQTTAKGAETAWKALGVKSDAMFEAQARAAQNAYTLIKSSATSTSADIMRAEEAKNAKLTQLNEQQYGKQTSFIDSLKSNWMAASAAIIAAWMLVNKAISISKEIASAANDIQRMSNTIGISTTEWQKFSYAAKMSDVSNESLMRGMKALSASMEEFNNKSGDGYKILTALGLSTVDVTGKQKPLTQMFKEVATEFSKYEGGARMVDYVNKLMGKSGMDLIPMFKDGAKGIDEYGDKLVKMGSVIGDVAIIAGSAAEDQFKNLDTRMNAMKINLAPLILLFAKGAENLAGMISWITKPVEVPWWLGGGTFSFFTGLQANPISALDKPFELAVSHGEKYVSTLKKVLPGLVDIKKGTEDAEKAAKKAADEADKAYAKAFSEVTRQMKVEDEYYEQQIKNTIEIEKADKKAAEEKEKEIDAWVKAEIEAYSRVDKENEEFFKDEKKRVEDLAKEKEKLAKDEIKLAADRLRTYHDLYKDLAGYEESYYESSKMIILNQEKDYRKLLIDKNTSAQEAAKIEILLAQRTAEELRKLDEERILRSNDFFGGMKVQMDRNSREMITWGQVGADVFKKFTDDAQKQLSDNLFNVLTGQFDKLGADWNSLWEGMLRTITDKLAKMAIEAATAEIFDLLGPAWDWAGSLFAAEGIWKIPEGRSREGVPVIAHPGEMIIPADIAEQIREAGGGSFQDLVDKMEGTPGAKSAALEAAMKGMAQSYKNIATIGGVMTATGKISPNQYLTGLLSPQAALSAVIGGAIPAMAQQIFGFDPASKWGFTALTTAAKMAGLSTLWGAPIGIAGMFLADKVIGFLEDLSKVKTTTTWYDTMSETFAQGPAGGGMAGGTEGYGGGGKEGGAAESGMDTGDTGAEAEGGASFRYGGISRGPESGYWARLHGTEKITPLGNGGGSEGNLVINSPLLYIEGTVIGDQRGLNDLAEKMDYMIKKINKREYNS